MKCQEECLPQSLQQQNQLCGTTQSVLYDQRMGETRMDWSSNHTRIRYKDQDILTNWERLLMRVNFPILVTVCNVRDSSIYLSSSHVRATTVIHLSIKNGWANQSPSHCASIICIYRMRPPSNISIQISRIWLSTVAVWLVDPSWLMPLCYNVKLDLTARLLHLWISYHTIKFSISCIHRYPSHAHMRTCSQCVLWLLIIQRSQVRSMWVSWWCCKCVWLNGSA